MLRHKELVAKKSEQDVAEVVRLRESERLRVRLPLG